jgi:gluconolactonase
MKPSGFTGIGAYGREPGSNGLAMDAKGGLHFCEHGDRRVSYLTPGGGKRTLADNYNGKRLNSPSDLAIAVNGDVYFTDPPILLVPPLEAEDGDLPRPDGDIQLRRRAGGG